MGKKPSRKSLSFWPEKVELDEGWARLIGLWLAEGHSGLYKRKGRQHGAATVMWSFGPDEEWLAEEVRGLLAERGMHATIKVLNTAGTRGIVDGKPIIGTGVNMYSVRCRTLWLYEVFDRLGLGHGAHFKRAPDLDARLVPALVGGWLDGDGSRGSKGTRTIEGFSRSKAMIRDMWRLAAKKGVFGRIYTNGQRLHFAGDDEAIVASWTKRLAMISNQCHQKPHVRNYRRFPGGWMVLVNRVSSINGPLDVVAIETVSGRYIAEDILTHNCLPMNEALGAGMPVITTDIDPNNTWLPLGWLVRSTKVAEFHAANRVDVFQADPIELAHTIDRFATDDLYFGAAKNRADQLAHEYSWDALLPEYEKVLGGD